MAKKLKKANDKYEGFEDELTLAELIQNAAARGMHSTKSTLYRDANGRALQSKYGERGIVSQGGGIYENPPPGATCGCAIGAMALTPKLTYPLSVCAMNGNDADDDSPIYGEGEVVAYADLRSMNIGLAYEQALRPEEV